MKKVLGLLGFLVVVACTPSREVVDVINGKDGAVGAPGVDGKNGNSCSVSDYLGEDLELLGAKIFCTDGSFSYILNGSQGAQGIQGEVGPQGEIGPQGESCSVNRPCNGNYVTVTCGESSARLYDGENGERGERGEVGLPGKNGKDGKDGKDGNSCAQTGTQQQTIQYQDYTILPVLITPAVPASSAYCKKDNASAIHQVTTTNCNQYNCDNHNHSCITNGSNYWRFYPANPGSPAVYSAGEYTTRTITVNIPTFSCGQNDE